MTNKRGRTSDATLNLQPRSALTNSLPQVEFLEFPVAIQTYVCVFILYFSYLTLAGGVARSKVPAQKFALRFHIMKIIMHMICKQRTNDWATTDLLLAVPRNMDFPPNQL